ncbi:MAG: TVP38/TMEM64 family protein [Anaerolineae bacterium]|nr:TVP38/TMEM64 family protein [Anaerolineae bacterium]
MKGYPIKSLKPKILNKKWLPWLGGLAVIIVLVALWKPLSRVGANSETLRVWIEQMGPLAPLVFFVLNVVQIVVAPIPGYPVQVLGGVLFGFIPGSIITVGGMVAGGTLAAWLGRRLGRPWLEKRIGAEELDYWTRVAHINSFWTWWIILLIPFGDVPYFIAGLSKLRLSLFALAILTSRGLFTVFIVWTGHSAVELPLQWLALVIAGVVLIVIIGFSQARRIEVWGRRYVSHYFAQNDEAE